MQFSVQYMVQRDKGSCNIIYSFQHLGEIRIPLLFLFICVVTTYNVGSVSSSFVTEMLQLHKVNGVNDTGGK